MGDWAEDALEQEMMRAGVSTIRPGGLLFRFSDGFQRTDIWTMKNGEEIKLEDMSPRHRGNTIRMLERKVGNLPGIDRRALHRQPLIKRMKELGTE